ncbi:hypothetical protein SH661x_000899 [Planctomicrobium sp. SH661]|uniref:hypothetical protein n=1 Tax=Planctomicrobium sp. SH661 TaxID=3448124 RepID=UPI003F5C3D99
MSLTRSYRSHVIVMLALAGVGVALPMTWQSASGEWDRNGRVGTFQLRSEIPLGEIQGQDLLHEMARLRADVESTLNLRGPGKPIQVNLFKSRETYLDFLQSRIPATSNRTAVFVQGTDGGQIYVRHHPGFAEDIRHECTHAVLHECLPRIPLWLDEGLAEYFEVPGDTRADSNPYLAELREQIELEWAPNLPALEALNDVNSLTREDYRACWGWTHFLLHGPEPAQQQLKEYLQALQSGDPPGRLSDRLRACLPDMDVQLINHLRNW